METTMLHPSGRAVRQGETVQVDHYVTTFELATVFCVDPEMIRETLKTKYEVMGVFAPDDSVTTMNMTLRTLSPIYEDSIRDVLFGKCEIISVRGLYQSVIVRG